MNHKTLTNTDMCISFDLNPYTSKRKLRIHA
jgi:hypothetical protein